MKTPRLSKAALEGLTRAIGVMEAGEIADDSAKQIKEFQAADAWVRKAWEINKPKEPCMNPHED